MGIYVFKRSTLLNHLGEQPEAMDFGGDVIPAAKDAGAPRRAPQAHALPCCAPGRAGGAATAASG